MPKPGWYADLDGHGFDLATWERSLPASGSPWVERFQDAAGSYVLLGSDDWNSSIDSGDVHEQALLLIDQLNGAMSVKAGALAVSCRGVMQFDTGGRRQVHIRPASGRINIRSSAVAISVSGTVQPPPTPSPLQKWAAVATANDQVADMLTFAGRRESWFDLYMAGELVKKIAGGKNAYKSIPGLSPAEFDRAMASANKRRHARTPPLKIVLTLEQTRAAIYTAINAVMTHRFQV